MLIIDLKEEENGLDDKSRGMEASETEVGEPTAVQTNESTSEPNSSKDPLEQLEEGENTTHHPFELSDVTQDESERKAEAGEISPKSYLESAEKDKDEPNDSASTDKDVGNLTASDFRTVTTAGNNDAKKGDVTEKDESHSSLQAEVLLHRVQREDQAYRESNLRGGGGRGGGRGGRCGVGNQLWQSG